MPILNFNSSAIGYGKFNASPLFVQSGSSDTWIPASTIIFGGSSGAFTFNVTGLTSGQLTLAAGTRAYSFAIISGSSTINGLSIPSPTVLNGGGYDTRTLTNSITVGTTGGYVLINWEV